MVFAWLGKTFTNLQATLESLYNFAADKVKIVRHVACRIAKVGPSSTSAIIRGQLRQLRELRDGGDLGISRFRKKCSCESRIRHGQCMSAYLQLLYCMQLQQDNGEVFTSGTCATRDQKGNAKNTDLHVIASPILYLYCILLSEAKRRARSRSRRSC